MARLKLDKNYYVCVTIVKSLLPCEATRVFSSLTEIETISTIG